MDDYDYVIYKRLHIHYRDGAAITVIDLDGTGARLWYPSTSVAFAKEELQPAVRPILVYARGAFVRPLFEAKYSDAVVGALESLQRGWSAVHQIFKVEERELVKPDAHVASV